MRYTKMIGPATRYSIIEYGICLWTICESKEKYTAQPFNFYLFPNSGGDLVMQPSSIAFLRQNNMDFGTWIDKGITYVDRRQAGWLKERFAVKDMPSGQPPAADAPNHDIILNKPVDIEFMERQKVKIASFMADTEAVSVQLDTCNNYLRKVSYQYLGRNHPTLTLESVKFGYQSAIVCKKLNDADRKAAHEAKKAEQFVKLQEELGFARVYAAMSAAAKPIVGHNCFFDCLFTMAKLDGILPSTLTELTVALNEEGRTPFNKMIDTKYLYHSGILTDRMINTSDTALGVLYDAVKEELGDKIKVVKEAGKEELAPQLHNAAYDAYITGAVFVYMMGDEAFKSSPQSRTLEEDDDEADPRVLGLGNILEQARGKLFMMQSMYHMDLNVGQEDPSRAITHGWLKEAGSLFHLEFDPPSVGEADIYKVFDATGIDRQRIELLWTRGIATSVMVLMKPPGVSRLAPSAASAPAPAASAAAAPGINISTPGPATSAPLADEVQIVDVAYYVDKLQLPEKWKFVTYDVWKAAAAGGGRASASNKQLPEKTLVSTIFSAATYLPNMLWSAVGGGGREANGRDEGSSRVSQN